MAELAFPHIHQTTTQECQGHHFLSQKGKVFFRNTNELELHCMQNFTFPMNQFYLINYFGYDN